VEVLVPQVLREVVEHQGLTEVLEHQEVVVHLGLQALAEVLVLVVHQERLAQAEVQGLAGTSGSSGQCRNKWYFRFKWKYWLIWDLEVRKLREHQVLAVVLEVQVHRVV
jgi:hypothetical protein